MQKVQKAIMKTEEQKGLTVGALSYAEISTIESLAQAILDSIATMKAGLKEVQGFLLRINEDNNVEIVSEVKLKLGNVATV